MNQTPHRLQQSSWNQKFFLTQWRNVVREMLINVLLKLCMQLITSDAQGQCVLEEISECSSYSILPSKQTCFIYSLAGCRVPQSSSEGQANNRESRLYCNHLWWVVECSWARIINYIISTPQPVFHKSTDTLLSTLQMSWRQSMTSEGICTGDRRCCDHEGCLV